MKLSPPSCFLVVLVEKPTFQVQNRHKSCGGIATRWAAKVTRDAVSIVFLKSNALGRFACLQFSMSRRMCVPFSRPENQNENPAFRNGQILQAEGCRRPLLLYFQYIPPRVFSEVLCRRARIRRPRAPHGRPPQLPTAVDLRRLAATSGDLRRLAANVREVNISTCTLGRFPSAAASHFALFSVGVGSSYLKTF